jgi:mono/diheme cytochrome c family protein
MELTMLRRLLIAALGCVMCLSAQSASCQDSEKGRALTRSLCANCHMGARPGDQIGRSGVPTFSAIANRPEQTFDGVVHWLQSVPSVMPNHHLTQDEILDLAAFVMSLRTTP